MMHDWKKSTILSTILVLFWVSSLHTSDAFTIPLSSSQSTIRKPALTTATATKRHNRLYNSVNSDDEGLPNRNVIGGLASIGLFETIYLTYQKYYSGNEDALAFCSSSSDTASSCMSVLDSPYAMIGTTDVPLSAVGIAAYGLVVALCAGNANASILTALITTMATISLFLISLLVTTLHQSCLYCLISATLCLSMAFLAINNDAAPSSAKATVLPSFITGAFASFLLFSSSAVNDVSSQTQLVASSTTGVTSSVVVADSTPKQKFYSPPPVTTTSSKEALDVAQQLKTAGAKLYGAYWCSHCYDQKQSLGQPAVSYLQYIECSKDGVNSQTALCKSNDIPGFPTWEINGQFYPGEQSLDELQEILNKK